MAAPSPTLRVFDDGRTTVEQSASCTIGGYVIVRLAGEAESLGDLGEDDAATLGRLLARVTAALETVVGADRVYCLVFAEVDRRLHVHLFPRTPWLLEAYWSATGTRHEPVNGPLLFEWARTTYVADGRLPAGPSLVEICDALRSHLR